MYLEKVKIICTGLILFILTTCFKPRTAYGKSVQDSLWGQLREAALTDQERLAVLLDLAMRHAAGYEPTLRDSALGLAYEVAFMTGREQEIMLYYQTYFSLDSAAVLKGAEENAAQMLRIAVKNSNDNWLYSAYAARTRVSISKNQIDDALENADKAYYYANQTGNPVDQIQSMLLNGYCMERKNRKIEAFRNYMDAYYLAERLKDNRLIFKCYNHLCDFYTLIRKYQKAKLYRISQINILKSLEPVDSIKLLALHIELANVLFLNGEFSHEFKVLERVLDYARRKGNDQLIRSALTVMRSTLISNGQFDKLSHLYRRDYPDELQKLALQDTTLYYRVQSFIHEGQGRNDSALLFYELAARRMQTRPTDPYSLSTFYRRYGEFLLRQNNLTQAAQKLELAYQHSSRVMFLPFMTEQALLLDSTYYRMGLLDKAYYYAHLTQELNDRLSASAKEDELLLLEIDNEGRKRELYQVREEEATKRRHNLQYMGIILSITTSFIILAMLGSFKVRKWLIKAMGFFSFIFFFEFLILLADQEIHHYTHGEPWKILAIKIVLIGILLPLHHWMEEKVVHFLTNHQLIDSTRFSIRGLRLKLKPSTLSPKTAAPASAETGENEMRKVH